MIVATDVSTSVNWNTLITALAGLSGVVVGGWITDRRSKEERRDAWRREQLKEFYAPMRGMREETKAKSKLSARLHELAYYVHDSSITNEDDPEEIRRVEADMIQKGYQDIFGYSRNQFKNELVPIYRRMLEHFTSHMDLAEPSTLEHYPALVEYVELWNRNLEKKLPSEIADKVDFGETPLFGLYADIERHFMRLIDELMG